ncbi:MAG TPA: DUF402 domain-containing protein [Catenuloplanes sp.]
MSFETGRLILHRNVRFDRLGWVRPARVVGDDARGLLLWLATGTPVAHEVAADGRGMRAMPFSEWIGLAYRVQSLPWQGPGVLKLLPPDAGYSVWWFRDAAGRFTGWYVNLEEPAVRWDDGAVAGVDIVDQDLDIVVAPDLAWQWKDEEEFTERLAYPEHYWVGDAAAVRAEGERVVKLIEAGEFPFDGTWCDFQPDPSWPVPTALPDGWDRPTARPR